MRSIIHSTRLTLGGEGGLVDLSTVETVAAAAVGGGEVLLVNSASVDSSDAEESDESAPLFGLLVGE